MAWSSVTEPQCSIDELRRVGLVGCSPAFEATLVKLARVAACDIPLLLLGDTGTGKELYARAAHYCSRRCNGPLIPINAGAIPDELFENEFFGHERGAYTDAREPAAGLIAQADGGTLFLDEVEALSLPGQAKLLRFLEERKFKPLGASVHRTADVRIIAASNENLEARVQKRTFREDLYYRLRVITIVLTPLRERREDIEALARHFMRRAAEEFGRPAAAFSLAALTRLRSYDWPGNVRELRNVIQAAVVLSSRPTIEADDLELSVESETGSHSEFEPMRVAKARLVRSFEIDYLRRALAAAGGNITEAARCSAKDRRAFFALMKKYDISGPEKAHARGTG